MSLKGLVDQVFSTAASADWKSLSKLLHPEFRVLIPAGVPHTGEYTGLDGFKEVFGIAFGNYHNVHLDRHLVCSGPGCVMSLQDFCGQSKSSGVEFKTQMIEMFKFKDDLLIEIRAYYWDRDLMTEML